MVIEKNSKVAAIQMCSTHDVQDNLKNAGRLIEKAASEGAGLAVLPEMFPLFEQDPGDKLRIKEKEGTGEIQNFISHLAVVHKIWIVAGTIPLSSPDPNKIHAACLVYNSEGKQVARFDKIHLFDVTLSETEVYKESDGVVPGNDICIVNTPLGKLGLCVCYDLRFSNLFSNMSAQGVEIIAAPSAFTLTTGQAHWELLCRSRAIDTFSYVIGACQGGKHTSGRQTHGHSMVVSPWGEILDEVKTSGNGIAYANIDLQKLYEIRRKIPVISS